MLRTRTWMIAVACTLLVAGGAAAVASAAADDEGSREVRVERIVRCGGENADCAGKGHRAIFINEDGEATALSGGGLHWVGQGGGFLGVGMTELTSELKAHFGVAGEAGVMVSKVVAGSPAEKAGLRAGDIVTAVDGTAVGSGQELGRQIRQRKNGETLSLEVVRDGRVQTLSAVVEEREASSFAGLGEHGGHHVQRVMVHCAEGEEGCAGLHEAHALELGCGEGETCEVQVRCETDSCTCTVNGEERDCGPIHRLHRRGGGE